jgi:hypothetical protein
MANSEVVVSSNDIIIYALKDWEILDKQLSELEKKESEGE